MRIALFGYDFLHKKTQDFLLHLWAGGWTVAGVIASPKVALPQREAAMRVKPRYRALVHPRRLAERMGIAYQVAEHNAGQPAELLHGLDVDVGVIAGARILEPPVIEIPRKGILNLHPGLLPEVRGLDALKWSVLGGHPPGVTAHLIDHRVDAGRLVVRRQVPVYPDDTWIDVSLRIDETQLELLSEALQRLASDRSPDRCSPLQGGRVNRPMTSEDDERARRGFERWKLQWAQPT